MWKSEIKATFTLAWPLIIAQLAQVALFTTDVIMMGRLGPDYLAAGTLATAILHPVLLFGTGVISAVSPIVAQALGGKKIKNIRRSVRQGCWMAITVSLLLIPFLLCIRPILEFMGQKEKLAEAAGHFMGFAAWFLLPALLIMALRGMLSAHGSNRIILWVNIAGVGLNILFNYALVFGNWGFPRLELRGSGLSTTLVNLFMLAVFIIYIFQHKRYKRYHLFLRFWEADPTYFFAILKTGLPIGLMLTVETAFFSAAAIMMGWIGSQELAAHAIALQCASIAFMVPLGLSLATTIRVGRAYGAQNPAAVAVAGWTSYLLGICFILCTAAILWLFPNQLISFFLDTASPANQTTVILAASYLGVAALFQIVDASQVIGAAALRGMSDTAKPMFIAIFGYWLIGMPIAYLLAFKWDMQGLGIWYGLAAGLAVVAVILALRFAFRERF